MSLYEFAILGCISSQEREVLTKTIGEMVQKFNLTLGNDVLIHDANSIAQRNKHTAFAAVYFGGEDRIDIEATRTIVKSSTPIIPTVKVGENFGNMIPDFLQSTNGHFRRRDDAGMSELAVIMLECVGLLRRQRRVFISYRRTESRDAALQLHDLLAGRGFDVFLDTHDIRPGDPFQDMLWHSLCDSDVMVMLDTPTYFESRWTREEIGRARAKEIHVLRVVWPGHQPTKMTELSDTFYLEPADLNRPNGPLGIEVADNISLKIEYLRSCSIASRYMSITGRLRADAERIGATIEGIGAHRAIAIRLLDERIIWAYPVVGIPTAETLNDICIKAHHAGHGEIPVLVYDDVGLGKFWLAHLKWLDENIKAVRSLKINGAGYSLAGWEP